MLPCMLNSIIFLAVVFIPHYSCLSFLLLRWLPLLQQVVCDGQSADS